MTEPTSTIVVHWQDAPPRDAARIDDRHYFDRLLDLHFVLWRGRWVRVTTEAMEIFGGLDEWLRDETHGLQWERFDG